MSKNAYWRKREEEQLKHYIKEEADIQRAMMDRYNYMLRQIEIQINDFYARYARAEKITLAEAQQRVSKMDVQAFAAKAKKYVEEKNFSAKANEELRLYNATMRINRLELLKANIGLETIDGFNDIEKLMDQGLTKRTTDELKRQEEILRRDAGILNTTVFDNAKTARTIVNASFNNATWSHRIWGNQNHLRDELSSLLTQGLIQGRNPNALAPSLRKLFGVSRNSAERLMVTEMARVQTEAQMESFKRNDIDEYIFLSLDTACKECMALNEKHFRVKDEMPGENAPPIHPNCRCSTAAYVDRATIEAEILADKLRKEAMEHEPGVTKDLKEAVASGNGRLEGLDNRIKGFDSLVRKLKDKSKAKGLTIDEYAERVTDVLRYTHVSDPEHLAQNYFAFIEELKKRGYNVIEVVNTFPEQTSYRGINTLMSGPQGYVFEIQYHTPQSLQIKNINHELYEEERLPSTSDERRIELKAQMQNNSSRIECPKNAEAIQNVEYRR